MIKMSIRNKKITNTGLLSPKDELNPKLWHEQNLSAEVQTQLRAIALDVIKNMEITAKIKDIIITGSSASYSWHELSDIDLHILFDFAEIDDNFELVKRMLDQSRINWNKTHNIMIRGHEVELYFQHVYEPHESNGIWSVLSGRWLVQPAKQNLDIDMRNSEKKAEALAHAILHIEDLLNEGNYEDAHIFASKLKRKLSRLRKAGLNRDGLYSQENLAFKMLRNAGYLEKLSNIKITAYDKMMSLSEIYIRDYFDSKKDGEHLKFGDGGGVDKILDENEPAPWEKVE